MSVCPDHILNKSVQITHTHMQIGHYVWDIIQYQPALFHHHCHPHHATTITYNDLLGPLASLHMLFSG